MIDNDLAKDIEFIMSQARKQNRGIIFEQIFDRIGRKLFKNEDPTMLNSVVNNLKNDVKQNIKRSMTT